MAQVTGGSSADRGSPFWHAESELALDRDCALVSADEHGEAQDLVGISAANLFEKLGRELEIEDRPRGADRSYGSRERLILVSLDVELDNRNACWVDA